MDNVGVSTDKFATDFVLCLSGWFWHSLLMLSSLLVLCSVLCKYVLSLFEFSPLQNFMLDRHLVSRKDNGSWLGIRRNFWLSGCLWTRLTDCHLLGCIKTVWAEKMELDCFWEWNGVFGVRPTVGRNLGFQIPVTFSWGPGSVLHDLFCIKFPTRFQSIYPQFHLIKLVWIKALKIILKPTEQNKLFWFSEKTIFNYF